MINFSEFSNKNMHSHLFTSFHLLFILFCSLSLTRSSFSSSAYIHVTQQFVSASTNLTHSLLFIIAHSRSFFSSYHSIISASPFVSAALTATTSSPTATHITKSSFFFGNSVEKTMLSYRLKRTCASQVRSRYQNYYRHSLSAPESFHIPGESSPNLSHISTLDLDYLAECGIQEPHYGKVNKIYLFLKNQLLEIFGYLRYSAQNSFLSFNQINIVGISSFF